LFLCRPIKTVRLPEAVAWQVNGCVEESAAAECGEGLLQLRSLNLRLACTGTMACSSGLLLLLLASKTSARAEDTACAFFLCIAALRGQGHHNKRHDNVRRAAISGQKCARPGDQVMKHATCRGAPRGEGSHQAGEPLLNPVWEGEAAACSAAGRGREGVETAFATASCRRSRRELRKPA